MSKEVTVTGGSGLGFVGALTILFIALKLVGVIAWSWVWVLSPLWIGFALWLLIVGLFFGIVWYLDRK
jgi:fatty acid desaturase